jgi:23S rRNA (cytidine1920-2'-O)/16S rRNA (cytidine1409-2'-O)-methyltransferase
MPDEPSRYVSRGGLKLEAALHAFDLRVVGWTCTDCGSHVGGFVDCLLQHGAAKVYAVDTGYGILDYRLRKDARVVVCERTNALGYVCPEPCDLVTIDVGWTAQRLVLPAARRSLKPAGRVLTLLKPQYEAPREWLRGGVVPVDRIGAIRAACRRDIAGLGWRIVGEIDSPLRGHGGNAEYLWLLAL